MSILQPFVAEIEAAADAESNVISFREARKKRVLEMMQRWADDTVGLGRELKEVRESFPLKSRGSGSSGGVHREGWPEWLQDVGLSRKHAEQLIKVYDTFGREDGGATLPASFRLLQYLSRDTIPPEARQDIISRIQGGEHIGRDKATEIVREYKHPKPEEARQIARETGKPTLASDNNIYLGATKEEEQQSEDRRRVVYGVRRAVETLAEMQMSGEQFIQYAFRHQLWNAEEEHLLTEASEWLSDLIEAWERR